MAERGRDVKEPAPPRSGGAGFTVVEVLVAIAIIGSAMLTVLMAASSGVIYQGMARQRQTANGIANQVMEQLRALPLADLKVGIDNTNGAAFSGDPNVKLCRGKGTKGQQVYRLFSCTGTADVGSAEPLVYFDCSKLKVGETCPTANAPLGSGNRGTIPADGVDYSWHAYLTSRSAVQPNRFVVVVNWTWRGRPNSTRVQSLAWAPSGCVSNLTHFVSAPCGKGSGGQGGSALFVVSVAWVDAAGVNQSFSWTPGSLTGTYREEGTQGKFLSGSSSLPDGSLVSTTTDNDSSTADAEATTVASKTTTWSSTAITTAPVAPWESMEVRFDSPTGTYPSADAVSAVETTPTASAPCNVAPFFFSNVPCMGLQGSGGYNPIVVAYRKGSTVSFPIVRIAADTTSAPNKPLWKARYDFTTTTSGATTTKTIVLLRSVPNVLLGSYSDSTSESGRACQDLNVACATTYVGSVTSLCDLVKMALGSPLVDVPNSSCGTGAHAGTGAKKLMTSTTCAAVGTMPTTTTTGTYSPCVSSGTSSGRMWKVSNLTFSLPGTLASSASVRFDYQVLSCAMTEVSGGVNSGITKCNDATSYAAVGTTTVTGGGGKSSTRTIGAVTPQFTVVVVFPLLTASAVAYEDW